MKTLAITITILILAVTAGAAPYYGHPDMTTLPDNARVLVYDPNIPTATQRDRNITGAKLKSEIIKAIGDPSDAPLKKQPIATSPYIRQMEVRDSTGKITYYVTAGGTTTIGTPVPLTISLVSPANGATGVSTAVVPTVVFNKYVTATASSLYIVGISATPVSSSYTGYDGATYTDDKTWTVPATLAPGTTYNIRVNLPLIGQDADDMSMTCGVMTDLGEGVCESTFTTAP